MSGRYEIESKLNEKIRRKLSTKPQILLEYYYHLIGSGKSYNTANAYISAVIKLAEFKFGENFPDDFYIHFRASDVNMYISSIRTKLVNGKMKRASDSLRTTHWSALNSFFDFLVPTYLSENPVSLTKRPKMKDNPQVTYLNESEKNIMLNNIKNEAKNYLINRDLLLFELGVVTGLRISAIVQIDLADIDFEHNEIKVIEKGDKDFIIFIGENLKKQLLLWINDRAKFFPNLETDALFISQERKRLSVRTTNDIMKKYSKGINKNVTPHVMRHTCATTLYEKTNDIYLCSAHLHHANVSTTQRYAEISDERKKYATETLDELI